MDEHDWLARQFEGHRTHLRAVAYRMLGSLSEADDAVQEAWLHLRRADTSGIENLGGWLTTVIARICLDMLRSRNSRREDPLADTASETIKSQERGVDPEEEVILADSVGQAMLVILDTLNPAERIAFVLHDIFDVPFETIAPIVDRSPTATRQLASRARRRVRGVAIVPSVEITRQREVVEAFLAASRGGDFDALLTMLDPEVVFRTATQAGTSREIHGASAVAKLFSGRAQGAQSALINGAVGIIVAPRGQMGMVIGLTFASGKIIDLDVIADPERLSQIDLAALNSR